MPHPAAQVGIEYLFKGSRTDDHFVALQLFDALLR